MTLRRDKGGSPNLQQIPSLQLYIVSRVDHKFGGKKGKVDWRPSPDPVLALSDVVLGEEGPSYS